MVILIMKTCIIVVPHNYPFTSYTFLRNAYMYSITQLGDTFYLQ